MNDKKPLATKHTKLWLWVLVIITGMFSIELINTMRIMSGPDRPERFPYKFVSKGVWSLGTFVRPLDTDSTDFSPSVKATYKAIHGSADFYSDFQLEGCSFLYPPTAVIELAGFAYLVKPDDLSAGIRLGDLFARLCALASIGIVVWFLRPIYQTKKQYVLAIIILAAFFPLRWAVTCVNVQSFINLFLIVLVLLYATRHNLLAGIMFGLAACLKPYLALLILFAMFRKEWRFVISAVATACLLITASIFVLGISPWKTYFFDLLPTVATGYGYFPNQSVNGIVHRWLGHSIEMVVAAESTIVTVASRIAMVFFISLSIWPRLIKQDKQLQNGTSLESSNHKHGLIPYNVLLRGTDIAIAILAVTLASPIVWDHYYGWCIILFAICFAINHAVVLPSGLLGMLACSYILLGVHLLPIRSVNSGFLTLINSTHFFGALLLLVVARYAQLRLRLTKS